MNNKQTHMMYGLLTGLAMLIVSLILYVAGLSFETWAQYITYIPFLLGLILNANAYAKANDNYVTYGNVFSSCFKATAIITIVTLVWSFIMVMIFPEMKDKAMEMAQQRMVNQGASDEQIEQGLEMTQKNFTLFMTMGIVFGTMFAGAIFSLIAAAVPKKHGQRPPHMDV